MTSRRQPALRLNPTLQLTAIADVSRRGRGRARIGVDDPLAVRWLLETITRGRSRVTVPADVRRQLAADGILVRDREVPRNVDLDPRLPRRRSRTLVNDEEHVWAVGSVIVQGPSLPTDIASLTRNPEPFLSDAPILWVKDSASGCSWPYRLGLREHAVIDAFVTGHTSRLPPRLRAALVDIHALEAPAASRFRRQRWANQVRRWRRDLRTGGFASISGLIPPPVAGALRTYYAALEREGYLYGGEARSTGLPLLHDEPVLEFLTGQLAATVAAITSESAPPTFTPYLRVYDPGATLDRHRDQPVCRWNVDLIVGGDPSPTRQTAWPLYIAAGGRVRTVRLGLGDAVLYQGTRVEHWRKPQPRRQTTAVASLHYGAPTA